MVFDGTVFGFKKRDSHRSCDSGDWLHNKSSRYAEMGVDLDILRESQASPFGDGCGLKPKSHSDTPEHDLETVGIQAGTHNCKLEGKLVHQAL